MKWLIFFAAMAMVGCTGGTARVTGRFTGHSGGMAYLEQVTPGVRLTADSSAVSERGNFRFKVRLPQGRPTLYNLRYGQGAIPLMLSAGERAKVGSMCDVALNYTVEGSPESERIRELHMLLIRGGLKLDSLRQAVFASEGDRQREAYVAFVDEMNRVKRAHISFIVREPARLSSLYALYQRLAGEQYLFAADKDVLYYRMVADSTAIYHPDSPYVKALQKEVERKARALSLGDMLAQRWEEGGDNYPDLKLPDIYGKQHTLSEFQGKVVVVDFWHSGDPAAAMNNAELKALYEVMHDRGLEIYQVSLDTNKHAWITSVQGQKLPWVSVGDMKGVKSPAAINYNITRLPADFVIARDGTIAARDLFGDELAVKINELL
jgi:peroxiredoxin